MAVNFGLLQPVSAMAPPTTQVLSLPAQPNVGQEAMNGFGQGIGIANQMQANSRANAALPGILQGQDLSNQGQALANQAAQIKLKQIQEEQIFKRADAQAYEKNGLTGYMKSLESHDAQAASVLQNSLDTHNKFMRENDVTAMKDSANIWYTIQNAQDPMAAYQQMKNVIKRVDPNLPEIKNRNELDAYAFGAMHTAVGYTDQAKNNMDVQKATALSGSKDSRTPDMKNAEAIAALQNIPDASRTKEQQLVLDNLIAQTSKEPGLLSGIYKDVKGVISNIGKGLSRAGSSAVKAATAQKTYMLNGQAFDMEAAKKATGLSEEEIVKQAGLQ